MNSFPICIGEKKQKSYAFIVNVLLVIVIAVLCFNIYFNARFTRVYVVGNSMLNTLVGAKDENVSGGDYVYVDRNAVPHRGDIVVIGTERKIIIKRIIAFGGDSVRISDGVVYLNGAPLDEPYVSDSNNRLKEDYPRGGGEITVPQGHVFFLGDNRDVSVDSRSDTYGTLSEDQILGVVTDWSVKLKGFFTGINTFFEFTVPSFFGG